MNENKLIKLLDLALERIDYLEAEAIESDVMTNEELQNALDRTDADVRELLKENEGFRRTIEDLERERNKLQNCFDKTYCESRELMRENELLMASAKEKDAALFELQSKLEKVVDQRNKLVLETANAGELGNLKEENKNLRETNEKLLRELESAREENEKLIYDTNNSDSVVSLRKENEKLSNRNRQLQADVTLLDDKVRDMMKNVSFTKTKWNDILDPTKRPRPNEPVLITTKSGKIIIGSFEVDGSIRSSGKPTKAKAWMALPKAFE